MEDRIQNQSRPAGEPALDLRGFLTTSAKTAIAVAGAGTLLAAGSAGGRWFGADANEVAFPLGGIGTGTISIGARGNLRDFEIWNEPRKGLVLPYSHFTLWAQEDARPSVTRVLEGRIAPPHAASHGIHPNHGGGLPRFAESRFRGRYPTAELELRDPEIPVEADLLAFTPLIPLDPDESGIPCAIFAWTLRNHTAGRVRATVVGSMLNPAVFSGTDEFGNLRSYPGGPARNRRRADNQARGVFFEGPVVGESELAFGNAAIAAIASEITAKPEWFRGGWYDTLREFWDDLSADGHLTELDPEQVAPQGMVGPEVVNIVPGSVGVPIILEPGESTTVTFIISWYFPNRINGWFTAAPSVPPTTRVRYSTRFANAWEVTRYVARHLPELQAATIDFRDALFESTLPPPVIDAVAGTMPVPRSNTCFWLADGRFFGWEGCFDRGGSCHGNCNHVWAYAQTLAFLFPSLEMDMLRTAFLDEVEPSGKMRFRAESHFGTTFKKRHAAADGQLGSIIRLWRTFLLTGDRGFLAELWPNARKCLDYALATWDTDGDGVLDGEQHNTYDIEFWGPNPLTGVLLLGALRAVEEMALRLDEPATAAQYRGIFERGRVRLDELLWNGEYYEQRLEDVDEHPYQHGRGCLSDQLFGQQLAHVAALGHLLPEEHVGAALDAIVRYNFLAPLGNHANLQRTYAFADESGLLLCSWPRGGRPRLPFVYSDEVWTGVEYHVAAHLIFEGRMEEGLALVAALRARHDGYRRNPWNEVECGHHYARSTASWALIPALTGFHCDVDRQTLWFEPVGNGSSVTFRTLFTCGAGWGVYAQSKHDGETRPVLVVLGGDLDGFTVRVGERAWRIVDGRLE
ncbi:MAG TPA: GH116 family glycosyl-hydrolase [Chloroflexota bacterium]|nr:GH116 family glycosyl-hydrolase [Chloroflexota bacterium]